jgi:hypothetical protein
MDVRTDNRGKYFTPRVNKESVAAAVRTTEHLIVGQIYVRPDKRLKDELNSGQERFVAVTDARVYDAAGSRMLFESSLLVVGYSHVIFISPLEAISAEQLPAWAQRENEEEGA